MAQEQAIWPDTGAPPGIKSWVSNFFAMADSKGEEAAKRFGELFQDDAAMIGLSGPLHGKESLATGIYQSRLQAWDTVKSRKHTVYKVYTLKNDFTDIILLGKLDSTMKNGRSYEMEFTAQVLFANSQSEHPKARSYKVWANPQPAIEAAKSN